MGLAVRGSFGDCIPGKNVFLLSGWRLIVILIDRLNHVFADDFESIDCTFSEADEGAVVVKDIERFAKKMVWLRKRPCRHVAMVRLGADSGGDSLKLMMNILFNDDPVLRARASTEDRTAYAEHNEGLHDIGVKRTYILVLVPRAKETFARVRWLWDIRRLSRARVDYPNATIGAPLDVKHQCFHVGISSGRFDSIYHHHSQYPQHSRPDEARTIDGIVAEYKARQAAIARQSKLRKKCFM